MTDLGYVKKHAKVTGAAREKLSKEVCAAYRKGILIKEIEERTGRSRQFIYRVLDESGVMRRGPGRPRLGGDADVAAEGGQHVKDLFQVALGEELRLLRLKRGWTCKELTRRLRGDVSPQTVTSWELGSRAISVVRLVGVVDVLVGVSEYSVSELLQRARRRTGISEDDSAVLLDLKAASRTSNTVLSPLQRWAMSRLRDKPRGQRGIVRLDLPALTRLAQLCNTDTFDLVQQLTEPGAELACHTVR